MTCDVTGIIVVGNVNGISSTNVVSGNVGSSNVSGSTETELVSGVITSNMVTGVTSSTGPYDHGVLFGLEDNDHPQYELVSNKSSGTSLGTSDTLYPTQNAVKTYVDNAVSVENLWDRTGTNLSPHYAGDTISAANFSGTSSGINTGDQDLSSYLYKPGISGGQTAYGGTNASDNLYIYSTSHATKGNIYLNSSSYYVNSIGNMYMKGYVFNETGYIADVTAMGLSHRPGIYGGPTYGLFIGGQPTSGASAIGVALGSFNTLTNGKVLSVRNNTTELWYTDYSGDIYSENDATFDIVFPDHVQFDIAATPLTNAEGLLQWNSTDGTLDLGMSNGDVTQQIGQELFIKAINKSGAQIDDGKPVYFNGRQSNRPKIYLAKSDSPSTSCVCGIATQDIADNAEGYITTFGYVRKIKTNYSGSGDWGTTWNEGDKLYVSKTVAGQLTNVEPSSPHYSDIVGEVGIVGGAGVGSIFVHIIHHKTISELSDVDGTPLTTSGQILVWNNSNQYWDADYNITDYETKAKPYSEKTSTYTITTSDSTINCTSGTFTVNLPTAVGITGRVFNIKNTGTGIITIDANGSETIDGELTQTVNQWENITIQSTGSNWIIL